METPKVLIVIPARYESTRLPGKPLKMIAGKPMIQWVYERAAIWKEAEVVVATDHEKIVEAVRKFGGKCELTSNDHQTGTDRVAEIARNHQADIIVNLQGDEPLLPTEYLKKVVRALEETECSMATLAAPFKKTDEITNPNVVKVVMDASGKALYFSRAAIPHMEEMHATNYYRHIGIYGFRSEFLQTFVQLDPSSLEKWEKLEQLRALENGYAIQVELVDSATQGVDTIEDLEKVRKIIERQ